MPQRRWYYGMKELFPVESIAFCNYKGEVYGWVKILWYELREYTANRKFKVVMVQNIENGKDIALNQGYLSLFPDDRIS